MNTKQDVEETERQFHYFGSTALNWCKDTSPENVLFTLAKMAGADTIKGQVESCGGLYAWVCRVEVPQSNKYALNFFKPVAVEISRSWEFNIMNAKGHVRPITREKD